MNEIFEKIYNNNNTSLNEDTALFEKVYMEVKMLNEMNPKLKALLAAGLIGTAGLGAASCSMPTDDPTGYEQPAPETPSNPAPENPDPDDPIIEEEEEHVETAEEKLQRLCTELKISNEDARKISKEGLTEGLIEDFDIEDDETIYIYNINNGFSSIDYADLDNSNVYLSQGIDNGIFYDYLIPKSAGTEIKDKFDQVIATYKAVHAE